jgi:hypothetical protein
MASFPAENGGGGGLRAVLARQQDPMGYLERMATALTFGDPVLLGHPRQSQALLDWPVANSGVASTDVAASMAIRASLFGDLQRDRSGAVRPATRPFVSGVRYFGRPILPPKVFFCVFSVGFDKQQQR